MLNEAVCRTCLRSLGKSSFQKDCQRCLALFSTWFWWCSRLSPQPSATVSIRRVRAACQSSTAMNKRPPLPRVDQRSACRRRGRSSLSSERRGGRCLSGHHAANKGDTKLALACPQLTATAAPYQPPVPLVPRSPPTATKGVPGKHFLNHRHGKLVYELALGVGSPASCKPE